jgi:hypothetical protein
MEKMTMNNLEFIIRVKEGLEMEKALEITNTMKDSHIDNIRITIMKKTKYSVLER